MCNLTPHIRSAKKRWFNEGDQCTKFFYAHMSYNRNNNSIRQLLDPYSNHITYSVELQNNALSYFSSIFTSDSITTSFPNIICKVLLGQAKLKLDADITSGEIKYATFQIDEEAALGLMVLAQIL